MWKKIRDIDNLSQLLNFIKTNDSSSVSFIIIAGDELYNKLIMSTDLPLEEKAILPDKTIVLETIDPDYDEIHNIYEILKCPTAEEQDVIYVCADHIKLINL